MLLADYVAQFLSDNGIKVVFVLQGGSIFRLIDSVSNNPSLTYFCNQHEQASAMAADGYARASGGVGCVMSTSGPGATNLLTGVSSAYYDSVPMLVITGQVSSYKLKGDTGVRIMDSQETDVVSVFKAVTKYCSLLTDPLNIRYELEKCIFIAQHGRSGPTLLDIPDDYQRMKIDTDGLASFYDSEEFLAYKDVAVIDGKTIQDMLRLIEQSQKPLIIAGWGMHAAKAEKEFLKFIDQTGIPVVCTYGANDLLPTINSEKFGVIGINGTYRGNAAIRQSDLLIIMGARMDRHTAMGALDTFEKDKKKIIIDIDENEINYFEKINSVDISICGDLKEVLRMLCWYGSIENLKEKNWNLQSLEEKTQVSKYVKNIFEVISDCLLEEDLCFLDTGCSMVWAEQLLTIKKGQRLFSAFNNTPMGWSLPAAIGAAVSTEVGRRRGVISINGDGGFQMNMQELSTVVQNNLNIKIIIFSNQGYGMIQKAQDAYLYGKYEATSISTGLAFPDFRKIMMSYGIPVEEIFEGEWFEERIMKIIKSDGYGCVIVHVSIDSKFDSFSR